MFEAVMAIFIIDLVGDDEDVVVLDSEEVKKAEYDPRRIPVPTPQLEIVPFDRETIRKPRNRPVRTN